MPGLWVLPESQQAAVDEFKNKLRVAMKAILERHDGEIQDLRSRVENLERFASITRLHQRVEQLEEAVNLKEP